MPKDNNAPSQNWNIKDQIEQSKKINQDNKQTIDDYKAKTESIKTIQSSLDELENSGQDVSVLRKKFDEKISNNDLSFGERLGVVGRNIGNDYVSSFSKAFGGNLEKTYSTNLDDIKQKREEVINPISTIATEVALDPLTLTPLNFVSKGTKTVRMAKDFVKGGALSSGLYTAKEYGDDNYKPTDSLIAGAFGGVFNSLAGRYVNRKYVDNVPSQDVTNDYNIIKRILDDGGTPFTKDANLQDFINKYKNSNVTSSVLKTTADELVQENIIKTDNQDEIAKRIYEANFKNKDNLLKTDDLKTNKIVNQNDIELAPIKEKSVLPDTLPLNDKEAMKDIMKYAKDNNAVDEFISKLPQNARVDEVRQVFDKMPISQVKETNVLNKMNPPEPRKTDSGIYYSNGTQSFGGASVGGLESEFNQRDYNYDGEHNYKDNVIGALIGAIGINAARKIFPNAFRDKNIDTNTTGMFVGKNPTDTIRVDNQGKYKIPLNEDVKELSKIKTDELNFKEFNNLEAKHKEQGITDSKSLKRIIDRVLQNPNIYAKGTQKDSSLVALRKNGADDIVVANSKNGNVISAFKNTDEKYMDKIIDKSMSGRPSSTVLRQGVDSTTSSKDGYNVASHSVDKSIPNNILNSQDIKLNASPTVSGGIVGAITGATSDLDNDGKITYKDLLYGAIGGAGLTKGVLMAKDSHIIQKSRELFKKASDTDFADAIVGHKIYEKKDYMNLREDMLKAKNQKLEDFTQLHEQLKLLDDSTRKDMYKYMSGDKNINLDTNIKTLADSYTNEISKLSKEMVDLGILDEAQFDKFKDRYLHRRYDKDLSQKFNSLFSKGKTVSGVFSRGKEWNGTKAEYEKLLNNGEIGDFFNGKIEATKMQNGQYKFRQDWTDEQRTKWGEIQDIAFSLPETLMRSTEMVQHGKMLKKIVDETKYVSDEALDGYVQLNGNKYGALKGKYVPKDMASDINEFHSAIFGNEGGLFSKDVVDAYKALSSFWKKTHTVYNPIAHMNNLLSNITMQFGAGINPHKAVKMLIKVLLLHRK